MRQSTHKSNRLMHIFDIQNDFKKHRERITHVKNRNTLKQIKKAHNSQLVMINSFRKNWVQSNQFKSIQKNRTLMQENKIIHQNLDREYHRENKLESLKKSNEIDKNYSNSRVSIRSSKEMRNKKNIQSENMRLMEKILTIQSTLSKDKMKEENDKLNKTRKRLEVYSTKNRERMRHSLRKMNIQPTCYFPANKGHSRSLYKRKPI